MKGCITRGLEKRRETKETKIVNMKQPQTVTRTVEIYFLSNIPTVEDPEYIPRVQRILGLVTLGALFCLGLDL